MTEYPDFVLEKWTEETVREFCEENGIVLNVEYKESNDYINGNVISQSRSKGTKVVSGTTLKITVAKEIVTTTTTTKQTTTTTTSTTTTTKQATTTTITTTVANSTDGE